jgi:hypothetical protein
MNRLLIILIIIFIIIYFSKRIDTYTNIIAPNPDYIESYRDIPYLSNKDLITYNRNNRQYYSRKNLPIYYPISSPLEDNYFNHINSITSPKLSLFRNILRQVYILTNQDIQPIIFNNTNRPIEQKQINKQQINKLSSMIVDLINKFGSPILSVRQLQISNELQEETEYQSRINFDIKLDLTYNDSTTMGKQTKPEQIFIQAEFIFEKTDKLPNENLFNINKNKNIKIDFKSYLSSLIVIGASHNGFIGGRYKENKIHSNKN